MPGALDYSLLRVLEKLCICPIRWTFTERTEVEFSQDLNLRLDQNSLIRVLLHMNGP